MTFRDVIFKNFKGSFQKYFAYFLSSSFSIMLFFMYATLILNKDLNGRSDTDVLSYIFPITMVAIALFSVFFINYAQFAFIKGRNKEFGIYITLGMNSKELRKLINMENIVISIAALLVGMGVGTLFARLFHMVILGLMEIKDIGFNLNYKPFFLTIGVFIFIFATVVIRTFIAMRKIDISSLLREARRSEGKEYSKKDPILGGLGLIIMAGSILFLFIIANEEDLNTNPLVLMSYMLISFTGVYLTISNGGNLVIHLIKKSKYYYKNMLAVTEVHYKFSQNKKIIFILSVLSTMTIFLVASPFSLLSLSEKIAEMDKNHLEYVETSTMNSISEETLDSIINSQEVSKKSILKFIFLSSEVGIDNLSSSKPVVPVEEYNILTGSNMTLSKGEAYNVSLDWKPGTQGIDPGSTHIYYAGEKAYSFQFIDSKRGDWVTGNKSFPSNSIIVISMEDYELISTSITENNVGYYHLVDFKNWKNSKEVVTKLRAALYKSRQGEVELTVLSIIDTYTDLRKGYSVFLFVSTVMGILFFVAGGSVLYFKQFTELPETKATFYKLYKIGISDKEMKGIVGKELLAVFFLPLIFGSFLGVSLIYLMTYIVGGDAIIKEFLSNAVIVIVVYFVSQGIFYALTKNKYIRELVRK
jgi:putative ABC transport system permease protein